MLAGANGLFAASLALTYFESWTDLAAQEFLELAYFPAWTADVRRLPDRSLCAADFPEAPSACLLCVCSSEVAAVPPHIRSRISMAAAAAAYTYIIEICRGFYKLSFFEAPAARYRKFIIAEYCRLCPQIPGDPENLDLPIVGLFEFKKFGDALTLPTYICMERHSAVSCRCKRF